MLALIDVVLPVFLVIGCGFVFAKIGYFQQVHVNGLMKFAQGFAIPCLLFLAISSIDLDTGINPVLLGTYFGSATICFILGIFGARLIFARDWEDCVSIGFICFFSNSVLLGLPITERAFGPDALTGNYGIIAMHAPYCYAVGVTVMEIVRNRGGSLGSVIRAVLTSTLKNVLLLAIVLGYIVNLLDLPIHGTLHDAIELVSRAGLPCALVALGGILSQYKLAGDLRVVAGVAAISLMVQPLLVWLIGREVGLQQDLYRSAVLTAAMAPGVNAYIFASMYGKATRVAASSVLITTAISVLSSWVWLSLVA